jgi:heme/copper-type cytochrome/quinol oxidase subunit 4
MSEEQQEPKPVDQTEAKNEDAKDDKAGETDSKKNAEVTTPAKDGSDKDKSSSDKDSGVDMYTLSPCCCCLCACSHDRVGEATCFGCLPIRCGVMFIAIIIFALAVTLISVTFFQLLNEYLPWWYCFITLLLLAPIAIAASFMIYFFAKDTRKTRVKLFSAILLSLISISLWAVWNLIFFLGIYKRDIVYTGMGAANDESNYHATPKRTYLFTILAEATFILVWLAYFTCVANQYCDLMNNKYDRDA